MEVLSLSNRSRLPGRNPTWVSFQNGPELQHKTNTGKRSIQKILPRTNSHHTQDVEQLIRREMQSRCPEVPCPHQEEQAGSLGSPAHCGGEGRCKVGSPGTGGLSKWTAKPPRGLAMPPLSAQEGTAVTQTHTHTLCPITDTNSWKTTVRVSANSRSTSSFRLTPKLPPVLPATPRAAGHVSCPRQMGPAAAHPLACISPNSSPEQAHLVFIKLCTPTTLAEHGP